MELPKNSTDYMVELLELFAKSISVCVDKKKLACLPRCEDQMNKVSDVRGCD